MTDRTPARESSREVIPSPDDFRERSQRVFLEETFRAHARFVANTLRRFGVAPADSSDQVQEVFLVVFRLQGSYDPTRPLKPWLFGIAYRVAGRYRQARGRAGATVDTEDLELPDPSPLADANLETKQKQALLLAALERVELDRRAVLILADVEGESVPTIAEALQIPLNTAYSRLRLAREELGRALARLRLGKGGDA